ncbi:hypothetical protein AK812_SmicGene6892 [Symbiodinium microadriaticum]|uniref:Uncharacterized protein n=1 Tax=Symbiodinium microadriaticum TaxID=2951 RepID=A0A1Q9EQ49_SYMMI|nr:hypothetical protein AK812_SmicGene6892 [Symbiodinium microadriaticum]
MAMDLMAMMGAWKAQLGLLLALLAMATGIRWGRNHRLRRLQKLAQSDGPASGETSELVPLLELVRGLQKMLFELQSMVTEEGAQTRQGILFEDVQARIQTVVNKAVANSNALEKMAQRLDAVHAGLAKTAANLHKEGMETIEDYLQTLKKDLQDFIGKAGQSSNEDLIKKLDTFLKQAFEKLKTDLQASLVTCTTTIQGDFNNLKKNQAVFGSAMADKFQEVLKEMAKNYDNAMKVCKETRDLVRWQQSQLETLQGRTDHLPDRLGILRDTLNDTQQLVLDVKGLVEDVKLQQEEKAQAFDVGRAQRSPRLFQYDWIPDSWYDVMKQFHEDVFAQEARLGPPTLLEVAEKVVEARQAESTGAAAQPELSQKKPAAKKKPTAVEKHLQELSKLKNPQKKENYLSKLPPAMQVKMAEAMSLAEGGTFTCRYVYSQVTSRILGSLQVALDTENDKVAGAEAKMAELDQTVKDAEVSLQAAKAYTSECEAKLKTASEAVCTSKATLTQRLNEQKKGDEGIVKARADKELLESTKSECFEKLKSGGAVAKEAKQLLKKIEPFIKQTGSDASLITAAPATLLKPPEERGSFDQIVLEQLEANFTAKLTEFETQLAEAAPAAEARAEEEVQKAQSTHEAAESKQKEASVELCAAKEAQKEANAVVAAAKKAVADYRPDYQAATATRDAKKEELETYVDGSLATFKELKERISAKKRRELAAAAKEEAAKALAEEAPAEEPEQDTAAGQ